MKQIFFICFAFCVFIAKGQTEIKTTYKVGIIPEISFLKKMTKHEIRLDSLNDKYNLEKLEMMESGDAFIPTVPQDFVQKQITSQKKEINHHYKDNRSRYILTSFKNDELDRILSERDTLTTECNCTLENDTIKVRMGMWVFGGFAFNIDIHKDEFSASYWEDTHKQKIYKQSLTDKNLVDNVTLSFSEQYLILEKQPEFTIGENILAGLKLTTNNYYRSTDYDHAMACDGCSDENMDTMHLDGIIYFKCKLREKAIQGF